MSPTVLVTHKRRGCGVRLTLNSIFRPEEDDGRADSTQVLSTEPLHL